MCLKKMGKRENGPYLVCMAVISWSMAGSRDLFNGDIKTHRLSSKVEENKPDSEKTQTVEESAQRSLELIGNITES